MRDDDDRRDGQDRDGLGRHDVRHERALGEPRVDEQDAERQPEERRRGRTRPAPRANVNSGLAERGRAPSGGTAALGRVDERPSDVPDVGQRQVVGDPPLERRHVLVVDLQAGDRAVDPPRVAAEPLGAFPDDDEGDQDEDDAGPPPGARAPPRPPCDRRAASRRGAATPLAVVIDGPVEPMPASADRLVGDVEGARR